jgi:flagellar basal body rod protein FlgC
MSDIFTTAVSGVQASSARFEASAKRVVSDKNADLALELVEQKMAALDLRANLAVLKTEERMMKATLDILA